MTRPLQVASTRDLGAQFVDNAHRMVGQDGAFSFGLPDGSSFWFFGDTLIGARPAGSPWVIDGKIVDHRDMTGMGPYERMINNTGLILPEQSGANGLHDYRYLLDSQGNLRNLIPLEDSEDPDWDRIWCQGGIAVGDQIILSFIQIRMVTNNAGPLPIGFEIVGSGLASARLNARRDAPFIRARHNGAHILWRAADPHFGVAFVRRPNDPFVYVYGTVNRDGAQRAYLARVPEHSVTDLGSYEYLADSSPRWSKAIDDCAELFTGMPSELSVSYNGHLGRYLGVHSQELSGKIVGRTADEPWGPWSVAVELVPVNLPRLAYERPYPFPLIYAGKEHPQLSPDGGRTIYLTYIEFEEYFPHVIEVVLS